jgi:hypothetical protein
MGGFSQRRANKDQSNRLSQAPTQWQTHQNYGKMIDALSKALAAQIVSAIKGQSLLSAADKLNYSGRFSRKLALVGRAQPSFIRSHKHMTALRSLSNYLREVLAGKTQMLCELGPHPFTWAA